MPNFGIVIGHDADPADVEDFIPYQPKTPGLQYTQVTSTASGVVVEGPFIRFIFSLLNESQNRAMLTQAGVLTVRTCFVTIYAQDENYNWLYLNGTAIKPRNEGRNGYFLNNVPLLITDIYGVAA